MDLGHIDSASSVGFVNLAVIDSVYLGLLICKLRALPSFYTIEVNEILYTLTSIHPTLHDVIYKVFNK